jgi:hypothetical protein
MSNQKQGAPPKVQQKNMFRNVTAAQASGERNTISVRSMAAKVYMEHLVLTPDQKDQIEMLYDTPGQIRDIQYRWNIDEEQVAAAAELAVLGLDTHLREALDSRWSVHWANGERKGAQDIRRVLYQWYVSL